MTIKKYANETAGYYTKALRFLKGNKVKFALSYSILTKGKNWLDDKKEKRAWGYFKQVGQIHIARALVLGKLKLSLVTFE